jgi:NAD(P)-dependent dehydrogenase (short-subunit alcohol dehydrogenase family)
MEGNDALTEEAIVRQAIERTPLRRFGEPEEIVAPTLFLASSAASFITGTVLTVDGGHTAV